MTDNALAYRRSHAFTDLGAQQRFTRRYRPQTNGKAERFNRTLADEWAYIRPFDSSAERANALPGWLHTYNHHRNHTALGGKPPISRTSVNNSAVITPSRHHRERRTACRSPQAVSLTS